MQKGERGRGRRARGVGRRCEGRAGEDSSSDSGRCLKVFGKLESSDYCEYYLTLGNERFRPKGMQNTKGLVTRKLATFFCMFVMVISSMWAASFGIEMGWTLGDLEKNGIPFEKYNQSYNISTYDVFPKSTHQSFKDYFVKTDTKEGIYQISAVGGNIATSGSGKELQSEYEKVRDQISNTYGQPVEYDFLAVDSIWNEPDEWMMAMILKERRLASYWMLTGSAIGSIMLEVNVNSDSEGFLYLNYQTTDAIVEDIIARYNASASSVF